MGSTVFTSSYSTSIAGYATYNVRVSYSESYNASTNKSTISITGVELQKEGNSTNWGGLPFFGSVTVNGTTLLSMNGGPSVQVSLSGSGYCAVAIPASSSVEVAHNDDGTGSFTLGVVGGIPFEGDSMFCALYREGQNQYPFGVVTASKTVNLTSRGHTLTTAVSPSGYGTVTGGATLAYGKTRNLTATPAATTAQHTYAFSHWTVSGAGASVSSATANPTTFTMGTEDATVTANFTRTTRKYTVTCEDRVESASGALLGAPTAYLDYGSAVSGASFGSDETYDAYYVGYHYTGSSSAITVDGDETVYRYFALNTWTVSYNANGGSGAPSSQTKTYGVDLTLSSTVPIRTGYDFLGWSTNSAATTAAYSPGGTYTANEGTVLYAVWQLKTYTVSYDANGGTGAPSSQTKTYGVDLTLSTTQPTHADVVEGQYTVRFDKKGGSGGPDAMTSRITAKYAFSFWQSNASGYTYSPGAAYQENVGCSMVAQWSTTRVVDTITLPTPTREGYTFRGWSEDPNASSGVTGNYTPSADVILYAIWQLKTFTLTISQGAGSVIVVTRDGIPLSNGATISYFDLLVIVIHASAGYNLGVHTVNGQAWEVGRLSVSSPVYVVSTASKKTYVLSKNVSSSGVTVNVLRTSSPIGGAPNGLLSDGATLYHNDVLTVSFAVNQGYTLETATVNGVDFSSAGTYTFTVTQDAVVTVEVDVGGVVYIGNGTTWEPYQVFIGNGSTWEQYEAFIGNGTTWEPY